VLVGIAFELGRDIKSLLLGEGAYPGELAALRAVFSSHDDVVDVVDLLTMRLARRCGRSPSTCCAAPWTRLGRSRRLRTNVSNPVIARGDDSCDRAA
jgi:hypothetical protein